MLTKTLAQLRTALLERAGIDSTGTSVDLTPTVLNEFVNDALYEGHDIITGKWADYFTTSTTINIVAGTQTYSLPTDFSKLRRVWLLVDTTTSKYRRCLAVDLDAIHEYTGVTGTDQYYRYALIGQQLYLLPTPGTSLTAGIKLWYIPEQAELVNDADTASFDNRIEYKLILAIGWRDILDRQELDPSPAVAKVNEYTAKLRTAADGRDADQPFYLNPRGETRDEDWEEIL